MDNLKLPLVSFIVTSFNYEDYVVKTLESIKNQTYQNIEIIVVDDFSTDNSIEKIKEFAKTNPELGVKLIKHSENHGQMASMQNGLAQASGKFVCFIDSDDVLLQDYCAILIKSHLSTKVALVSCQIMEIDEDDEIQSIGDGVQSLRQLIDLEEIFLEELNLKTAPFGGWYWNPNSSAMFRKSAIDLILDYKTPENWRICPDKFLFNFAHLVGGSAIIDKPLVAYRRHEKNAGASNTICGNTRYHVDKTQILNIKNNAKIRQDMINFIWSNKKKFAEKFGTKNVNGFILKILVSYFKIGARHE